MFGDNVSALKPASLSQVLQEALISFLCINGMNYCQWQMHTHQHTGWLQTHIAYLYANNCMYLCAKKK